MATTKLFSDALRDRRVALVYSFPKADEPSDRWYDRWKTRVVMSYGEALERLGAFPYYCEIDTFCEKALTDTLPAIDAAVSLNAGVRPVSHFALVPAVAQWRRIPIIPCTADVIMAGERKDLANCVAMQSNLAVPKIFRQSEFSEAKLEPRVVVKPRDLGGSFGLRICSGNELIEGDFALGQIVQRFVPGYDVTIPVFRQANSGRLAIGDATVYLPSIPNPREWVYDRAAKEAYVSGEHLAAVVRRQYPLQNDAVEAIREFAEMIGVDCFGRIDFRLTEDTIDSLNNVSLNQLSFIEINPMPTVCAGLAFVESIRSYIGRDQVSLNFLRENNLTIHDDYDIIAFVLANALLTQLGPTKMNDRDKIGS